MGGECFVKLELSLGVCRLSTPARAGSGVGHRGFAGLHALSSPARAGSVANDHYGLG